MDTMLTGPLEPGQWILGFLGAAREVIDAERAAQVEEALVASNPSCTAAATTTT
jgi:hydrogenase expression/formation protein HypC